MARKPMMAGNWKMNKTLGEAVVLAQSISNQYEERWKDDVDVVVCPPFIDIKPALTVFEFDRIKDSKTEGCGHPSSKPVPLIAYLVKQCTQTNGLVLDGFLGSASTLIACDQLERICYGVELEPKFVDVAVQRYIAAHDGSFADVYVERDGEKIPYADVPKPEEV